MSIWSAIALSIAATSCYQAGTVIMNAVTNKVVTIVGGMATLGELLPGETSLAAARLAGFIVILGGTVLLARFGGGKST